MAEQGQVGAAVAKAHEEAGSEHPANKGMSAMRKDHIPKYKKAGREMADQDQFAELVERLRIDDFEGLALGRISVYLGFSQTTLGQWINRRNAPKHAYFAVLGVKRFISLLSDNPEPVVDKQVDTVAVFTSEELKTIAKMAMDIDEFDLVKKALDLM